MDWFNSNGKKIPIKIDNSIELKIIKRLICFYKIKQLGALASSPVAGFTVERLGRKGCMILFSFPFILGWIVVAFANNVIIMCIGRFITGKSLITN